MTKKNLRSVTPNPWEYLQQFTPARLALGRAGNGIPTQALLDFRIAHARARDAVHSEPEFEKISAEIENVTNVSCIEVCSSTRGRLEYLKRPDLGRALDEESRKSLLNQTGSHDLLLIVGDGLSASAVNLSAASLVQTILKEVQGAGLSYGPVILARQARVALGDEVGEILKARLTVMLIGERPGLSNLESIGAYVTYAPRKGRVDAERNCISNISPAGLPIEQAAVEIVHLVERAMRAKVTGVALNSALLS